MASWQSAPYLHFPNSTYLDSLSNNTDPYTIYYGQSAIVSSSQVIAYGVINILGIVLLSFLVGTILFSNTNFHVISRLKNRYELRREHTSSSTKTRRTRTSRARVRHTIRIQRDPCLINAFIVLIFVNTTNLLYWLSNKGNIDGDEIVFLPHEKLCRAQAILQAGSQAAQMSAVLAVVLRLWLKTITLTKPYFDKFRGRVTLAFLLALPYLLVIGFIPKMVILTANEKVPLLIPTPFYCSLVDLHIRRVYQILTGVIAILTLLMELWVIHLITSHFRQTSRTTNLMNQSLNTSHGVQLNLIQPQRLLKRSFYVRVGLFIFWTVTMIATTLYQAFDKTITDATSDLVFACMGLIAFFCFATQADILRTWNIPATTQEWRELLKLTPKSQNSIPELPRSTGDLPLPPPIHHRNWMGRNSYPSGTPQSAVLPRDELDLADFLGDSSPGKDDEGLEEGFRGIRDIENQSTSLGQIDRHSQNQDDNRNKRFSSVSKSTMTLSGGKIENYQYENEFGVGGIEEEQEQEDIGEKPIHGLGINIDPRPRPNRTLDSTGMFVTLQEGMEIEDDLELMPSLDKDEKSSSSEDRIDMV